MNFRFLKLFPELILCGSTNPGRYLMVSFLLVGLSISIFCTSCMTFQSEHDGSTGRAAGTGKVIKTVIVPDYYPYSFVNEQGLPDGFSVDITNAVVRSMSMKLEIGVETWERARELLENGTIDFLPMMASSHLRKQSFDFSVAHTVAYDAVFVRKGTESPGSLNDLAGKTVIVMNKDAAHDFILTAPVYDPIKPVLVNSLSEALGLLSSGRGDAAIMPKLVGLFLVKKLNIKNIEDSPRIIDSFKRPFSFAVRKGDTALLERLSQGLSIIDAEGGYNEIHNKWFGVLDAGDSSWGAALKYIAAIGVIFLLIWMILLIWSLSLKKLVRQRTTTLEAEIDARKKTEEALRESEERFSLAMEATKEGIWDWDMVGGRVFRSDAFYSMLGYTRDDFQEIAGDWFHLIIPEDTSRVRRAMGEYLAGNQETHEEEFRVRTKSGEILWIRSRGKVVAHDENLKPLRMVGTQSDVTERKKSEEALLESEEEFRSVFQNSLDGILFAAPDGRVFKANPAACSMLGRSEQEICEIGRDGIADKLDPRLPAALNERIDTGHFKGELNFSRKDGVVFPVEISSGLFKNARGELRAATMFKDITERKQVEKRMRLNEERLESLYSIAQYRAESVQELLDFALAKAISLTGSSIGYIYFYDENKELFTLNTWSPDVMKHCRVESPETVRKLDGTGLWGEAVRQKKPIMVNDFHSPNLFQKGRPPGHIELLNFMTVPVMVGERIVAVVGVGNKNSDYDDSDVRQLTLLMDSVWKITEAKRGESVQRRLATAVEHAAEGVMITGIDGTIEYVNKACMDMTGYEREELLGQTPRILNSGEHDVAFYRNFWRTIASGEVWTGTLINRRKDGTLYTQECTVSPVRDSSDTITNFVELMRDVTQHLELSRQLFQAQKMESIGTLAGGIAHDFNNLLQVVLGYTELVITDEQLPEQLKQDMSKVRLAAGKGADLVQRLLTFSRKTETRPLHLDLNQRIHQTQEFLQRTIPKMINIELIPAVNLPRIHADPTQVDQVLMNLALNARDAMTEGGKLIIKTESVFLDEDYARTQVEAKPGNYVVLSVSDTGSGMDKETREHIFEPFFTTKAQGKGTGLGLAVVFGIVKQHQGFIECYSEVGIGTTFKVYFPAAIIEAQPDDQIPVAIPQKGSETILLVDDEELIRSLGERLLTKAGYKVITACNGREALEIFPQAKDRIALAVLDLMMPEMGGIRCMEELLTISPHLKVIVTSGYSADALTREALSVGAKGFIAKPFDIRHALEVVRNVLDEK